MNAVASALQPSNSSSIRYYLAIGPNASLEAEPGFGAEWGTTGVWAASLPQTLLNDVAAEQRLQASQAAAAPDGKAPQTLLYYAPTQLVLTGGQSKPGHRRRRAARQLVPALLRLPARQGPADAEARRGDATGPGRPRAGPRGHRLVRHPAGGRAGADGRGDRRGAAGGRASTSRCGCAGEDDLGVAGQVVQHDGGQPAGARSGGSRSSPGCSGASSPTSRTSCAPR